MRTASSRSVPVAVEVVFRLVAWAASRFKFGDESPVRLMERWVVVEFEKVGAATIDTLVVMSFHDHSFLSGCR